DGGATLFPLTLDRLGTLLISSGAVAADKGHEDEDDADGADSEGETHDLRDLALAGLDGESSASVANMMNRAKMSAGGIRDRLSGDVWRLVDMPLPPATSEDAEATLARAVGLQERFSALAGLAAENMGRTAGWRFHDMGRRIER